MGKLKKKFNYRGKLLTIEELMAYSVVPEKTLHNRLYTTNGVWEVESAVNTPFGQVGKTPEISKGDVDSSEHKHNKKVIKEQIANNHIDSTIRGTDTKTFICISCGHIKPLKRKGKKSRNAYSCTACDERADEVCARTEQEIKIRQSGYKFTGKKYKEDKVPLFFLTNEKQ